MAHETDMIAEELRKVISDNPDLKFEVWNTLRDIAIRLTDGKKVFFCWQEMDVKSVCSKLGLRQPTTEECITILANVEDNVDWGTGLSWSDLEKASREVMT